MFLEYNIYYMLKKSKNLNFNKKILLMEKIEMNNEHAK